MNKLNKYIAWNAPELYPVFPFDLFTWYWLVRRTVCRIFGHKPVSAEAEALRPQLYRCARCHSYGGIKHR